MSLLEDLNACLLPLGIPIETGVFSDTPPDEYLVITPLGDSFGLHADNAPLYDVQEARLSYFNKGSYTKQKNAMIRALLVRILLSLTAGISAMRTTPAFTITP